LVYFHGGRFISGDLDSHDTICRLLAIAANCRVVAVDYRLAPEHRFPTAADDAAQAVKWALGQGIPVAVAGDSAGANLAAGPALVLTAEYDTLRDEGEAYAHKLGGSAREYPGTIHGFFTMPGILRVAHDAMKDAAAFLKRHW